MPPSAEWLSHWGPVLEFLLPFLMLPPRASALPFKVHPPSLKPGWGLRPSTMPPACAKTQTQLTSRVHPVEETLECPAASMSSIWRREGQGRGLGMPPLPPAQPIRAGLKFNGSLKRQSPGHNELRRATGSGDGAWFMCLDPQAEQGWGWGHGRRRQLLAGPQCVFQHHQTINAILTPSAVRSHRWRAPIHKNTPTCAAGGFAEWVVHITSSSGSLNFLEWLTEPRETFTNIYQFITHSSILTWESFGQRSLVGYSSWGHKGSTWLKATQHSTAPVY